MVRLNSTGVRLAATLSAFIVALIAGFFIVKPLIASVGLSEAPSRVELIRAIAYDKRNPSHYYRTALLYYYDLSARDLDLALQSYLKAIALNPVNAMYWLGLVDVFDSTGKSEAARSALTRALYLNPSYAKPRWMAVNLLLKEGGERERIVFELSRIIKDFPRESLRAFSVLHQVTNNDVELILEDAIAAETAPMVDYLSFLMSRKDTPGVLLAYKAISSRFEIKKELALKYINYLASVGELWEARRYLDIYEGRERSVLVLNGGFEEDVCSNALCWQLRRVKGVDVSVDDKIFFEGRRSLKIDFDGSANVNFYHVSMLIPLKADHSYRFATSIMTEGLSTTNGFFVEFYGAKGCKFRARTEVLTGSKPWQELSMDFLVPAGCSGGTVRFRRLKSKKLDSHIRGSVWVDALSLTDHGVAARSETKKVEGAE